MRKFSSEEKITMEDLDNVKTNSVVKSVAIDSASMNRDTSANNASSQQHSSRVHRNEIQVFLKSIPDMLTLETTLSQTQSSLHVTTALAKSMRMHAPRYGSCLDNNPRPVHRSKCKGAGAPRWPYTSEKAMLYSSTSALEYRTRQTADATRAAIAQHRFADAYRALRSLEDILVEASGKTSKLMGSVMHPERTSVTSTENHSLWAAEIHAESLREELSHALRVQVMVSEMTTQHLSDGAVDFVDESSTVGGSVLVLIELLVRLDGAASAFDAWLCCVSKQLHDALSSALADSSSSKSNKDSVTAPSVPSSSSNRELLVDHAAHMGQSLGHAIKKARWMAMQLISITEKDTSNIDGCTGDALPTVAAAATRNGIRPHVGVLCSSVITSTAKAWMMKEMSHTSNTLQRTILIPGASPGGLHLTCGCIAAFVLQCERSSAAPEMATDNARDGIRGTLMLPTRSILLETVHPTVDAVLQRKVRQLSDALCKAVDQELTRLYSIENAAGNSSVDKTRLSDMLCLSFPVDKDGSGSGLREMLAEVPWDRLVAVVPSAQRMLVEIEAACYILVLVGGPSMINSARSAITWLFKVSIMMMMMMMIEVVTIISFFFSFPNMGQC